MRPHEQTVVANVAEMTDASAGVADRSWNVKAGGVLLREPDAGHGFEIEAAGRMRFGQCARGGCERIDTEAAERIRRPASAGLEACPEIRDPVPEDAYPRSTFVEDGQSGNERTGMRARDFHEAGKIGGTMLSVSVKSGRVGEAAVGGVREGYLQRRAFAVVGSQAEDFESLGFRKFATAVGGTVDNNEDRPPKS